MESFRLVVNCSKEIRKFIEKKVSRFKQAINELEEFIKKLPRISKDDAIM